MMQLDVVREKVVEISGRGAGEVRVVACPYRICPLGAHIDHQGGTVTAMTINYGVLLGFVASDDAEISLQSGQFEGVIRFRVDDLQKPIENPENINWESYARGAVYALQNFGYDLKKGIIGYISGVKGLDSSGLSSSAAVGIAYLMALENVNDLVVSPVDNIQLDNYFALTGCNITYRRRVDIIREFLSAKRLPVLFYVLQAVKMHQVFFVMCILEENLARRAEHYFSEMKRVVKGRDAWARGDLHEFSQLISASGRSSILNYECGSKEMIQLYEILLKAPGVLGARFSGAGFRGCCLAVVESGHAEAAAAFVRAEYEKAQPELVSKIPPDRRVLVCEPGDGARVI
uniref:GHMP kinase C-terminal domain-containing protein n=1 Tax=Oryza meridionalis TaxID=40149 RepID=A0A0E0DI21_9ORYZ